MNLLTGIIIGLVIGGIVIVVLGLVIRNERIRYAEQEKELHQLREDKNELIRQEATIAAQLSAAEKALTEAKEQAGKDMQAQQKLLESEMRSAREHMRAQFEKEILERSEQLKKANTENMQQVVGPLKRELDLLREAMEKSKESSDKNTASLEQSIRHIIAHDQERDKTTQTLANALKNRGKVQGDWGEQVLTNILRDSGLREGEEYMVQDNVRDEEGKNLRPDVVVKGADGTRIIIDSKVSLTAYSDYVGAEDDEQRKVAIKTNYDSIWKHVEELAKKNYAKLVDKAAPIVLMFVPNEGSYILAMNHDPNLGTKAYQRGILIINPTNLMVVLRLILLTWQNSRQEKHYEAIRKTSAGIYEKYVTFVESYIRLGNQINTMRGTYETGVSQLREGRGNLSSRLESLLQYGVTTTKRLPADMTPILSDEQNEENSAE